MGAGIHAATVGRAGADSDAQRRTDPAVAAGARRLRAAAPPAARGRGTMSSVARSVLPGVRYGSIERHGDERGSFRELWRTDRFGPIDPAAAGSPAGTEPRFVQANLSTSSAGVLRGLHLHQRQLDHWVVATGRAFVALVDVRPMLTGGTRPLVETRELAADDWVDIPIGVAHGFLAVEPLELIYFVTNL